MRILVYGINYYPELTGIGRYTSEMCAWLAARGHQVVVITGKPFYPEWEIHPSHRGKWWQTEIIEGVTVNRCPLYVPAKASSKQKILHELSFLLGVFPVWAKTLFQKKFDVVIHTTPPFHLGFFGAWYKKIKHTKLVTHIQDLQIDAAKDLGLIKNQRFLNLMLRAEKYLLNKSDMVSTISSGMKKKIINKGFVPGKIVIFPNWVDEHAIFPLPVGQSLRPHFGLGLQDTVILYSGNIGEKQGLEILIDVCRHFENNGNINLLLWARGAAKKICCNLHKRRD